MANRKYQLKILTTVRITATNKRFAQTLLTDMQRRIKTLEAHGFSPVHGTYSTTVLSSAPHPNPREVSQDAINKAEIRICAVYDLKNLLATGGFDVQGPREVEKLYQWLNSSPAYTPVDVRNALLPFTNHIDAVLLHARLKRSDLDDLQLYEAATKSYDNPNFAFWVKIETPVRMYRPDGEYSSSWSYTRSLFGFGSDYESALRCAYKFVSAMRAERML